MVSTHALHLLTHHGHPHARASACARHRHEFWQIEHIQSGRAGFLLDGEHQALPAGAIVLIPPGAWHGY